MHCQECRLKEQQMNYQPRGISDQAIQGPASYASELSAAKALLETQPTWNGVTAEAVARMRLQNRFKTGLDIARYTAALMRADMAAYEADLDQEALRRQDRSPLSVSLGLDDRSTALRVRTAARPVDAREDLGAGADRGAIHLPPPGGLP